MTEKTTKTPLKSRLFKIRSHPRSDFIHCIYQICTVKMGTKKPRSLSTSGFLWVHLFWMHNMVAEVGFERPTRKYSRRQLVRGSASRLLLIFSLVALASSRTASTRTPSPLPPSEVVKHRTHSRKQKEKQPEWVAFFLVAEVGFEPHDLRVMSPTSYQAALLRDIDFSGFTVMVPVTGVEPVRYFRITGF